MRSDENPALDVARLLARQYRLPLLVYHGLSEHYRFASDRHHTFILQGARDLQQQLQQLGISYAFHLATPKDRSPHLVTLARDAALVVTEDMPVDPPRRFLTRLCESTRTPILCVDTACIVPMQLVGKPHTRAFQFRKATQRSFAQRLTKAWPILEVEAEPFDTSQLPFETLELSNHCIAELVAECDIDHAVGPVVDTVGGSSAGYHRWNGFREEKLAGYARNRNDALKDGVSRMSPYLHYGMVSPMRLAREAAAIDNPGAEKFLDELLIWRELAYVFCYYREDHDQWSALPEWARQTLEEHADDRRHFIYSWEQLARGQTHDPLWNAAQKSLLMQGELHNNVRMTWGKAILNWTPTPQSALGMIKDLNHRYALDGRDPASYGGILWCLGQFDRPFEPARSVLGRVRPRPTETHARRLDVRDYHDKVTRPRFNPVPRVAVIGAGISGLFAARTLADHGLPVAVYEQSREDDENFDNDVSHFAVQDERFQRYVDSWQAMGLVAGWPDPLRGAEQPGVDCSDDKREPEPALGPWYVGVPDLRSLYKHLATDLDIISQPRVSKVQRVEGSLALLDEQLDTVCHVDRVVVSGLFAQVAQLLVDFSLESAETINATTRTVFLVDDAERVAICGNPDGGSGMEVAFLGGMAAAGRILATLSADGKLQTKLPWAEQKG